MFEVTDTGTVPLEVQDTYKGTSLLRFSNEELSPDTDIWILKPEKRKSIGKVKYKGKPYFPPEREIEKEVKQKRTTKKVTKVDCSDIGEHNILPRRKTRNSGKRNSKRLNYSANVINLLKTGFHPA